MVQTKYPNVYVEGSEIFLVTKTGRIIKLCQWIDNVGYYQVSFRINGKRKYVRSHRLIAETLLPNPHNLPQINHKDGNKLNNSIENLEWTTNSANTKHGYEHHLYHSYHRCHEIVAICKETGKRFEFKSIRNCATELGLNRKTITSILKYGKGSNYPYTFSYKQKPND